MDYEINFPHLGIYLQYVIKSINIGSFSIAIYGITMATALIVGLLLTMRRAKETAQKSENYIDLFIWLIIFGFIGARAYYVIFSWDSYKNDLLQIFNLRAGGIAMYGGIIAGIITVIVFCKAKKMNFLTILDTVVMGVPAGQIIGRWGNFFNREAFGGYTDNLFAMQLPVSAVRSNEITQEMMDHVQVIDGVSFIQVHPTFLYEGIWNLGLVILLWVFRNKTRFKGENFLRYVIGYGIGRFWVESLRTDQLKIASTGIPVSMLLSAVAVIAALVYILIRRRHITAVERAADGAAAAVNAEGADADTEEISKEEPKTEATKEEPKTEELKTEELKTEEPKTEEPKEEINKEEINKEE